MKHWRRDILSKAFSAITAAAFLLSALSVYLHPCNCGDDCVHRPLKVEEKSPENPSDKSGACCAGESQDDAPAPQSPDDDESHCGDDGQCPCPYKWTERDSKLPIAPVPALVNLQQPEQISAAVIPAPIYVSTPELENAPLWRPARGSPLARSSLHKLYSVYII